MTLFSPTFMFSLLAQSQLSFLSQWCVLSLPSQRHKKQGYLMWPLYCKRKMNTILKSTQTSIDLHDTLSTPRPKLWCHILLIFLLSEQLILNYISSYCVEGHISNFALSCQLQAPIIWNIFRKTQETSNFMKKYKIVFLREGQQTLFSCTAKR